MATVTINSRNRVATVAIRRQSITTEVTRQVISGSVRGPQGPQGETGLSGGGSVAPIAFSYGDASAAIYTPAAAGVLTTARIVIETPFDGVGAALTLGTLADPDAAMDASACDPSEAGEYEVTADLALDPSTPLRLAITPGAGASQGAGLIYLTFVSD